MELNVFRNEISQELEHILSFWKKYAVDEMNGGFNGRLDAENQPDYHAVKGSVLNARILWTFSAAYIQSGKEDDLKMAQRAFEFIVKHFLDKEFGGTYWSVQPKGEPAETRKQIYALAFTLYGFAEFARSTGNSEAKTLAIDLYSTLEKNSHDPTAQGYIEAFSRNWDTLDDQRLSDKDRNSPFTMNTHLHIIEAYANLYKIWPDAELKATILRLLDIFSHRIIHPETSHLGLFFDHNWQEQSSAISFGHDIEASWLLLEVAEIIGDKKVIEFWKVKSIQLAKAALEGMNPDGSLNHEYDPSTGTWDKHKEWWVSAEAMVGFFNAYTLTGDRDFLHHAINTWTFIKQHLKDGEGGEWFWGVYEDYTKMKEDKIGMWKCPYHNARACLELLDRLKMLTIKEVH